jgi:hypothetical protein
MTSAATTIERGFSTRKIFYPEGGKSAPGRPITSPEAILKRIADLTDFGPWTRSTESVTARELAIAIASIAAQRAAATGDFTVGRDQIADLLAASVIRGLGICPELDTLYADGIITRAGEGRIAICGPPGHGRAEKTYPGWSGPATGLRHVSVADQQKRFLYIAQRLTEHGLPEGVGFPADIDDEFQRDRERGEITLPAWAWAVIFNQSLAIGEHPVSRRTAGSRLGELRAAGQLVMTRISKTRLNLVNGCWHTTPASYALPRPGLQGVMQRFKAKVRAATTRQGPSEAWRLQAERWRWRDMEARCAP